MIEATGTDTNPVTAEDTTPEVTGLVPATELTDGEERVLPGDLTDNGLPFPNSRGVFRVKLE